MHCLFFRNLFPENKTAGGRTVPRNMGLFLGPRFLCMHKPAQLPFWVPGLVPVHAQECCACTRVLCMHKNLVHAQEPCVDTILV